MECLNCGNEMKFDKYYPASYPEPCESTYKCLCGARCDISEAFADDWDFSGCTRDKIKKVEELKCGDYFIKGGECYQYLNSVDFIGFQIRNAQTENITFEVASFFEGCEKPLKVELDNIELDLYREKTLYNL
ncbi:MAG: hypothetical protein ACRC0V_06645 [Fusobacteriaceae bacterium]